MEPFCNVCHKPGHGSGTKPTLCQLVESNSPASDWFRPGSSLGLSNADLKEMIAENTKLRERVADLEGEIKDWMNTRVRTRENEILNQREKIIALEAQLQAERMAFQKHMDSCILGTLTEMLKARDSQLKALESQLSAARAERLESINAGALAVIRYQAELAAKDTEIARFRSMSTVEMMCENESILAHVTEWESRCLMAESQLQEARRQLAEATEVSETCGREHTDKWIAEIPRVTHSDEKWRQENARLAEQLKIAREAMVGYMKAAEAYRIAHPIQYPGTPDEGAAIECALIDARCEAKDALARMETQ